MFTLLTTFTQTHFNFNTTKKLKIQFYTRYVFAIYKTLQNVYIHSYINEFYLNIRYNLKSKRSDKPSKVKRPSSKLKRYSDKKVF